jgi:hypothetical protein
MARPLVRLSLQIRPVLLIWESLESPPSRASMERQCESVMQGRSLSGFTGGKKPASPRICNSKPFCFSARNAGEFGRRVALSLLFLLLPFAAACGVSDPREGQTILIVGKRGVTPDQLKRDMKRLLSEVEVEVTPEEWSQMRRALVERLVDHYLILEYGREKGITVSEEEVDSSVMEIQRDYGRTDVKETLLRSGIDLEEWREGLREQVLTRKIIDRVMEAVPPPSEEEIRAYFQVHAREVVSRHPGRVQLLPEVALEIQRRLSSEKEEAFFADWIKGLRERFPVTLNEDLLMRLEWSK